MVEHVPIREVPDVLLSRGLHTVSTRDIQLLTGLDVHGVHAGMARLRSAGKVFSPAKGFYVIIPPHYRGWGSVPALDFIDPMMGWMDRSYYISMLSAAELHGAAHQRPQVFQVMVDRHVPDRDFGRTRLRFFTSRHTADAEVIRRNSATGSVRVASTEVTALDLTSRPSDGGGLSNVATVVSELASGVGLDPQRLVTAGRNYPAASLRRLGWILDHIEASIDLSPLDQYVSALAPARAVVLLDPSGGRVGRTNRRWGLVENSLVEIDQ